MQTSRDAGAAAQVRAVAAAAAGVVALMFLTHWLSHDVDITRWVRAGEAMAEADELPPRFYQEAGLGYDGQYFYRIARSPLSTQPQVDGISLDRPSFRQQRIGYPILAWGLSAGGRQAAVPWALVMANAVALVAASTALALLAARRDRNPWLGIAGAALPASVMAFHFDLAEATEAALLLWALVMLGSRRWLAAAVLMCAAALTRETALILPLALTGSTLLRWIPMARRAGLAATSESPAWLGPACVAVYLGWSSWVSTLWDLPGVSTQQSAGHLRPDPTALIDLLIELPTRSGFDLVAISLFLAVGALGVAELRHPQAGQPHERLALIGTTLLVVTFTGWARAIVYLRQPGLWILFALVVAMSGPDAGAAPPRARVATILTIVLALVLTIEISSTSFPPAPSPGAR